jgi:hypothetical protein
MRVFSIQAEFELFCVGIGQTILEKCIALGAFHNSAERFDPPKCHPNTREAIMAKIEAWVKERPQNGERLVLWMYGPAGAGKLRVRVYEDSLLCHPRPAKKMATVLLIGCSRNFDPIIDPIIVA